MNREDIASIRRHTRQASNEYRFSIVIPVLYEQDQINSVIEHLRSQYLKGVCEIIVVDGDSRGETIKAIQDREVVSITSAKGRAIQMNAGAAVARGEILIFLHADTRLPPGALKKINTVLENEKYVGGAFDLRIDSDRLFLKYIAARASLRSRLNRIPYGDQAIFIRKNYFDKIGRFKEIPLMEDVELMRRIKRRGDKIFILRDRVKTSARRWEREGVFYTTLKNQMLVNLYYLGVSPDKLAKYYRRHS
ncbi:MAG: TIGR04283 family arsenosugar biosynthesis glycosyltransferase [Planctomycetota bacterium]|jgi:rSAM/selenodomain-associated transferase 2